MRSLIKNKQQIHYALYLSKTPKRDSNNLLTGEYKINYGNVKALDINISPGKGESDLELFGTNVSYDHILTTNDMNCEINENTIVWYDTPVYDNQSNLLPHNYIVVKRAKGLNSITYALKGVDVN